MNIFKWGVDERGVPEEFDDRKWDMMEEQEERDREIENKEKKNEN